MYVMTPTLHMSTAVPYLRPLSTSGPAAVPPTRRYSLQWPARDRRTEPFIKLLLTYLLTSAISSQLTSSLSAAAAQQHRYQSNQRMCTCTGTTVKSASRLQRIYATPFSIYFLLRRHLYEQQ